MSDLVIIRLKQKTSFCKDNHLFLPCNCCGAVFVRSWFLKKSLEVCFSLDTVPRGLTFMALINARRFSDGTYFLAPNA